MINKNILAISLCLFFVSEISAAHSEDSSKLNSDSAGLIQSLNLSVIPSTDTLYRVAKQYMGKWAHLFLAIKIEESGNDGHYSWLSLKHFNLCGMRYPKSRKTYAIASTNTNYAIYRNWFESLLDFKIYMEIIERKFLEKKKRKPKDEVEMIHFMFNNFNHFAKWKKDMLILIRYVKKKYH